MKPTVLHLPDELVWESLKLSEGIDACWFLAQRTSTSTTGKKYVAFIRGTKSWAWTDMSYPEADLPPGLTLEEAKAYVLTLYRMR